ncbi:hypothetical protein [Aeromonas salmonicida]|uniref:hypothetical protein n=1 Tax=Aeromonas salmonicida TaxID=645 RepID=UPI003F7B3682
MSATIITMEEFKTAAQQAELAAQFVRRPVSVQVLWSESDAWAADQLLSFGEFEAQALGRGHGSRRWRVSQNQNHGHL